MKTPILAILLAGTTLAGAVTITFNQDTASVLDFNVEWGSPVGQFGENFTGPGGSVIWWMGSISRNPNKYFVEIHDAYDSRVTGFNLTFWGDPEYSGPPVPTAYGSPNLYLGAINYPLDTTPYGARFLYTPTSTQSPASAPVPDAGGTGCMLALGMAGLCGARRALGASPMRNSR